MKKRTEWKEKAQVGSSKRNIHGYPQSQGCVIFQCNEKTQPVT